MSASTPYRPVARPLTDEEEAELTELVSGALVLLPAPEDVGLDPDAPAPGMYPQFIGIMAEARRRGFELPFVVADEELALRLGALYGDELCRVAGWDWEMLSWPSGLETLAVVSPDRSVCVLPLDLVGRVIADPTVENVIEGVFGTVVRGEVPVVGAGRYVVLG